MKEVALADLCEVYSGGTPSRSNLDFYRGDIPWAKISDIEKSKNNILTKTEESISKEGLRSIRDKIFPAGTLLFAMYGSIGKTVITGIEVSTNQAILGIQVKNEDEIDLKYLQSWFKQNKQKLINQGRGVALKNLSATIVRNLKIPIPENYDDQVRIAGILSRTEGLIEKRKKSIRLLDEFLKSTFLEMFGDPVRNEKGWERVKIRDLINEAKYGTSKPARGGQHKYLRMNNITNEGYWDFTSLKYIDMDNSEIKKYSLQKNDLVFNRTNSKELVGKTAVYNYTEEIVIAGYLIRVRTKLGISPWYIWGYLNSKAGKLRLFNLCRNIVGMANINAQELQDIPILKPPKELQNQFASIVEKVEAIKAKYQVSLEELEGLYGSLSQRAYKGELDLSRVKFRID